MPSSLSKPLIGIAPDIAEPRPGSPRATCPLTYTSAIAAAGGRAIILPPVVDLIPDHLELCDGFVLIGGDDPRTEPFGAPTHPKATPVHPQRQAFDTALLRALNAHPETPTLGICLGMQMMALCAGGQLDQHLPDTLPTAANHFNNACHHLAIPPQGGAALSGVSGTVTSHHRQAVIHPGSLRIIARSEDGVIEAIDNPRSRFFLGVQWHPERTDDPALGIGIFKQLVEAARAR